MEALVCKIGRLVVQKYLVYCIMGCIMYCVFGFQQVTQGDCRVSILGDVQNLPGQSWPNSSR